MSSSNEKTHLIRKQHKQPTVRMISLGCPRTLVDSELYLGGLAQSGFKIVNDPSDPSDAVIINTCSFVQDAIKESIDTILEVIEQKKQGKIKAVIVAGCLVQRFKDELINELHEVDGFVGVDAFAQMDVVVRKALKGKFVESVRARPQVPHTGANVVRSALTPPHYAYLKISEGCLKGCSFCIIPKIKGPLSSRPIEDAVAEAKQLVEERGVKELIVVGQDTSDYGVDLYGKPLIAKLLGKLAKINGLKWIRLLYCHPRGVTQELMDVIREESRICKYLDIAIEHADDEMLKRMNRGITQEQLRGVINGLRQNVPGIALRSAVIVGFPGETESSFGNMVNFLQEVQIERLGAFPYSHEEGSAAYRYPDQVPESIRQERYHRIMKVQQEIARIVNERFVGQKCEVIIDEADADDSSVWIGRTRADCPEVDGVVFVHSEKPLIPGTFVNVEITDSYEYDLVAKVV